MAKKYIGIFDSGKGGLTVLDELKKTLPFESYLYYGDIARLPFGSKTKEEILAINRDIISFLIAEGAKVIVMACNTSSAIALPLMKKEFPEIPIIGLIGPAASEAISITHNSNIGVFATKATISSHIYKNTVTSLNNNLQVTEIACPEFVSIVENDNYTDPKTDEIIKNYCQSMQDNNIDTLIHGCTHYPYLEDIMKKFLPPNISFINPAQGVAALTESILKDLNLLQIDKEANTRYIVSKIEGGQYVRIDGREQLLGSSPTHQK